MDLLPIVEKILSKKDLFLALTQKYNTPFYAYDQKELDESIERFTKAFKTHVPHFQAYFAVKLNHHPFIVKRVVEKGLGLDVASKRELSIAVNAHAADIVYFSPGKSEEDLTEAVMQSDTVRLNIDSFNELHRLGAITNKIKRNINASIRLHLPSQGSWTKYGIPLSELKAFWEEAVNYPFVRLSGIHLHQSRNRTTDFYTDAIRRVAEYIGEQFSPQERTSIKCVDFGGGFEPYRSEGVIVQDGLHQHNYSILETPTIEEYAHAIGGAITSYLTPLIDAAYFAEPGRYICNSAMHIVLSIADVKDAQNVILDGGVNMVGWQRFESEYFPLINLSSPAKTEMQCNLWGNLCTTWDIWGYRCYASDLSEGDIIIVPHQGALSYSLAQSFINDIPPVIPLY
jgi:diaminopimelate decarboxylase